MSCIFIANIRAWTGTIADHNFRWDKMKFLDKESRLIPRKIKETIHSLRNPNHTNKISCIAQLFLAQVHKFYCFRSGLRICYQYALIIIYITRRWEKHLSKRSLNNILDHNVKTYYIINTEQTSSLLFWIIALLCKYKLPSPAVKHYLKKNTQIKKSSLKCILLDQTNT